MFTYVAFKKQTSTSNVPDVSECVVGYNDQGIDPLDSVTWNGSIPNLSCKYKANQMTSFNVIENYKEKFGQDQNWKSMMEKLCSTETDSLCIIDPITGRPFKKCSKINSTSDIGDQCRVFYKAQSEEVKNSIAINYCFLHGTNPDCKCMYRDLDPKYRKVKPYIPINESCWYPACGKSSYIRTQDLVGQTCPTNICKTVFDSLKKNNINISENNEAIDCIFNDPDNDPDEPKPPSQTKNPVSVTALVIIGTIVFLIIVGLLAVASSRR